MLNDQLRSWIYNKIQGHYKRELYFQGLDIPFYLSVFKFCLFISKDFKSLELNMKKYGMNDCLNFVRKNTGDNKKLYFSYPNLSFQAESLFHCWDEILQIQKQSGEDISKAIEFQRNLLFIEAEDIEEDISNSPLDVGRFCYGNKPNLAVEMYPSLNNSIQEEEERKVFPISVDFKYEYNSFRRKVILSCEHMIEKKDIIFVQTDIKTFFHNLQIESLAEFIENKFNAKNLCKYLRLLSDRFEYNTLPIGWTLSRFIANIITQEFHTLFKKYLAKNFQNSLERQQFSISKDTKIDLSKKWQVKLKHIVSYVDDFIFLLETPVDSKGIPEEIIAEVILKEANNLLNQVLVKNTELRFHSVKSEKTKYYRFNKSNISILKTNFSFFNTADDYLLEDPEIKARIDDVLLPIDNDITLNSNQQFHRKLRALQKVVIGNHNFKEKEVYDLLAQIRIKIEKTGSRYIRSVFGLFRLLELRGLSDNLQLEIKKTIEEIFKKFKKNNSYSFEWVKFFNGYFNFLHSIEYQDIDRFFNFLSEISKSMKIDDKMLFRLLRNEYIYKCILNRPDKISLKKKVLGDLKKANSTLLNLSNQRSRAIHFLNQIIRIQNDSSKISYKPLDLTWMNLVLNKALLRKHNINAIKMFSIIEGISIDKNDPLFHFGLSRIGMVYLPFNTMDNQTQFINKIKGFNLMNVFFWKIVQQLIKVRENIRDYYRFSEKGRIKQILDCLKNNNTSIKSKKNLIWYFIKKSFSSEQEKICAYFMANRFNNEGEFIKYILTSNLKTESSQLTPWSVIPLTFQKTGIQTNLILKELFTMKYNRDATFKDVIKGCQVISFLENSLKKNQIRKLDQIVNSDYFGVIKIDLNVFSEQFNFQDFKDKPFKITLAPLYLRIEENLDFKNGFKLSKKAEKSIDLRIRGAIDEAIRQRSSILIFPELSIPKTYLGSYLRLASGNNIVLIGGLEYSTNIERYAYNSTIVSIPVRRSLNPGGREYFAFEQIKNFPSSEECYHLSKNNFKYQNASGIFIFKSDFWGDFAVLTCSDFLSLGLRWILQSEVQTVFVPAQNNDSATYDHISETSIRDLHCLTIVCNNPEKGSSHCYAPYYDRRKRQIFKKIGVSTPEYHTFEIDPREFRKTQKEADPTKPFRNLERNKDDQDYSQYKQLPPDWRFW